VQINKLNVRLQKNKHTSEHNMQLGYLFVVNNFVDID